MTGYVLKSNYTDLATSEQIEKFEDIILNEVLVLKLKDDNGNYFLQGPCVDNLLVESNSPEYNFIKQVYKFQKL
jgi:hypothetical protein